jgi:hypothetical protein
MGDSPINLDTFLSFNLRIALAGAVIFFLVVNLKDKSSGYIVLAGIAVVYLFTFITGRYYLINEGYEDASGVSAYQYVRSKRKETPSITQTQDIILDSDTKPYYDKPINDVDDYEYSMIFDTENDREITKELRNKLMSQYPMDWTTNPPSSTNFTKGQKASMDVSGTIAENPTMFQNISADNVNPPDTAGMEEEERKILQTYQPKNNKDLKTYDIDDAYTLIKKIYDAKGEIPYVKHKKDTNVYEIVGTRRKDAKVVYEDEDEEAPYNPDMTQPSDVAVPQAAVDKLASVDPYFDTRNRTRLDKNDYTRFTPGLERMFAPTFETEKWY